MDADDGKQLNAVVHDRFQSPPQPTTLVEYMQAAQESETKNGTSTLKRPKAYRKRHKELLAFRRGKAEALKHGQGPECHKYVPMKSQGNSTGELPVEKALDLVIPKDQEVPGEGKLESQGKAPEGEEKSVDEESLSKRIMNLSLMSDHVPMDSLEQDFNRQEQADEILALEAIFGEDFVKLDTETPAFTIGIHVQTTPNVVVSAELPSLAHPTHQPTTSDTRKDSSLSVEASVSTSGRSTSDKATMHEFSVQFLPPIRLMCNFPRSYPSRLPPNFVLMCSWLEQPSLASLCRELDTIWKAQPGQVVCYAWISWLQENSLCHLGFVEKVKLGTPADPGGNRAFNVRAISGYHSVEVVIPQLLRYNEEKCHEVFSKSLHSCRICFSEFPGIDFPRMPCQHTFCRACMQQYCAGLVKEGSVNRVVCPDTSCKNVIPPWLLKELLSPSEFKRWEELTLKRALDAMTDIEYCPRCEMACIEDDDHHVQCGQCFFSFCSLCRAPWHVAIKCATPDELLIILQGRQARSQQGENQRRKEQHRINDLLSAKLVNAQSKRCPTCHMAISKTGGCNKMYCTYCLNYFCFICGIKIDDYDHFRENCPLFEEADIQQWM